MQTTSPTPKVLQKMERPPIDEALIQEIARKIVEAFHPNRIILIGSRARGDYHEDSDVDIFVEMESDEKRYERRIKIRSLFQDRWWPMDILVYTPEEVKLRKHSLASIIPVIEQEGRILYARDARP